MENELIEEPVNLIGQLENHPEFSAYLKDMKVSEIFIADGELHITSYYPIARDWEEAIKAHIYANSNVYLGILAHV